MTHLLQYVTWAVSIGLNLLVIAALVRGPYRDYRFPLAYAITLLLTTVVEIAAYNKPPREAWLYYWTDELILAILVFCVVIAFIDRAAKSTNKPVRRHWLILFAALIPVVSLALRHGPMKDMNAWMTLVGRDLNLCAVVLDLVLWSILIASRRPDRRLLLLSGGLGVQLTGAILGQSIRHISRAGVIPGSALEVITSLLGLYIWWRAFSIPSTPGKRPA
ncbi:MAG: hypothetical protein U0Q18_22820 [Bryobacteraceae bacterium]